MAQLTVQSITDRKIWEDFIDQHPESNFLQSWAWGEFQEGMGRAVHRIGFYDQSKLIGVMLGAVEDARRGRFMAVAGGPIIDWQNDALVELFKQTLLDLGRQTKSVFIRVRPQLLSSPESMALYRNLGFRPAPMHLSAELTSQLDITKTEEELLAGMRKNTRYEIRKAQKNGIKVEMNTDLDQLKDFYDLQVQTSKRQHFVPFSYTFLKKQFEVFTSQGNVVLYTAKLDGKVLAQAFIIFYGQEAAYHYGASTELGRKEPGAYIIQWEAILEAKKRGMSRYNFWGVAPAGETQHRFYGVSVFKRGFGGEDTEYLHAQDLVINRPRYLVNSLIEHIRKKLRKV